MSLRPLFREAAIREHERDRAGEGRALRLSPWWTRWAYHILTLGAAIALVYLFVGRVDEYASGPAVVIGAGTEIHVQRDRTVEAVFVLPGDSVETGDPIVSLWAGDEQDQLERLNIELQMALAGLPRSDTDQRDLAALRFDRDLAAKRLSECTLRAPHDGVVEDVMVRRGQRVSAGETTATIRGSAASMLVIAFLPGYARPEIAPGQHLRLEVEGHSYAYLDLTVLDVGAIVGPGAARRFVGGHLGDALSLSGGTVFVRARLPATFSAVGRSHEFFPGMQGVASVRLKRESLLAVLVPGVRYLQERLGA